MLYISPYTVNVNYISIELEKRFKFNYIQQRSLSSWASLVAQLIKNLPDMLET